VWRREDMRLVGASGFRLLSFVLRRKRLVRSHVVGSDSRTIEYKNRNGSPSIIGIGPATFLSHIRTPSLQTNPSHVLLYTKTLPPSNSISTVFLFGTVAMGKRKHFTHDDAEPQPQGLSAESRAEYYSRMEEDFDETTLTQRIYGKKASPFRIG